MRGSSLGRRCATRRGPGERGAPVIALEQRTARGGEQLDGGDEKWKTEVAHYLLYEE